MGLGIGGFCRGGKESGIDAYDGRIACLKRGGGGGGKEYLSVSVGFYTF